MAFIFEGHLHSIMKSILRVGILILLLVSNYAKAQFVLYNYIKYNNTPGDLSPYLKKIYLTNQAELLTNYTTNPQTTSDNLPNYTAVASTATSLQGKTDAATLDIEVWPDYTTSYGNLSTTISMFKKVLDTFHKYNNTTPVGYYGAVPNQAYQWKNIDPVNNPTGYNNWNYVNKQMLSVAQNRYLFSIFLCL